MGRGENDREEKKEKEKRGIGKEEKNNKSR